LIESYSNGFVVVVVVVVVVATTVVIATTNTGITISTTTPNSHSTCPTWDTTVHTVTDSTTITSPSDDHSGRPTRHPHPTHYYRMNC